MHLTLDLSDDPGDDSQSKDPLSDIELSFPKNNNDPDSNDSDFSSNDDNNTDSSHNNIPLGYEPLVDLARAIHQLSHATKEYIRNARGRGPKVKVREPDPFDRINLKKLPRLLFLFSVIFIQSYLKRVALEYFELVDLLGLEALEDCPLWIVL
ncbi:hypothetical protein F5I97DRAFT_1930439 [Phlebopus sp. FC_14]|nr:hypothetical protein F5I97DRAFT_1930439 [Phlebopus sp. FC_14]